MTPKEAKLYALVHDGAPGDVAFYRSRTRGAHRVLELGCGWGRVASQLECAEVVGLESDPGMRALGRVEGFEALAGDMREFELGRFEHVIIPFTGIYCLETEEDLLACLRSARRALAPGGTLIFDAYAADRFHAEARPEDYPDDQLEEVARFDHEGVALTVYERSRWDRESQRMDATYVYEGPDGSRVAEIEIKHRYLTSVEIPELLSRAGLLLVHMAGSFEGEPFDTYESGSIIVTAACGDQSDAPGS